MSISIQLYHGNCIEFADALHTGDIDVVVTDPPYGIDGGRGGQARDRGKGKYKSDKWSDTEEYIADVVVPLITTLIRNCKRVAVTPGIRCMSLYPRSNDIGCFYTPAGIGLGPWGFTTFHPILYYGKYHQAGKGPTPTGIQVTERANVEGHPCPKPLKAWTWLVEKVSIAGETVFDPFMGSGTTGIACIKTGRNFIGCEIDENYFNIAEKRIKEVQSQPMLSNFDMENKWTSPALL